LFNGEELTAVPDGVEVIGNRIRGCLGDTGCKFPARNKPLACKMSPAIQIGISRDGDQCVQLEHDPRCPARMPRRFYNKVRSAIRLLRRVGVWQGKIARLEPITPEEAQSVICDLRKDPTS